MTAPDADTAARSLAHWSEAGRQEMQAFYALAGEDYRRLALAEDWPALLARHARPGWRLLDVACGSGKWPTALQRYAALGDAGLEPVGYDLLDLSEFSVREARSVLRPPFVPGAELVLAVQDLPTPHPAYDVVWAVHALYAVPPGELDEAARRLVAALAPGGLGVVAQATSRSHYLRFYDAYRAGVRQATPFTSAEQVAASLRAAGASVHEQVLTYRTTSRDDAVVEGFLQRCAFDDETTLTQMRSAPVLGDYLASCRSQEGWCFAHEVSLLRFSSPETDPQH